jgi:hypothetical protein
VLSVVDMDWDEAGVEEIGEELEKIVQGQIENMHVRIYDSGGENSGHVLPILTSPLFSRNSNVRLEC